mmetsp:Transcript_14500/g.48622  ORF Transcript_14500/g.48622 Transcript_14500/m.48622 type:complete len:84 (+) Transcript_14500:496-747(+)
MRAKCPIRDSRLGHPRDETKLALGQIHRRPIQRALGDPATGPKKGRLPPSMATSAPANRARRLLKTFFKKRLFKKDFLKKDFF